MQVTFSSMFRVFRVSLKLDLDMDFAIDLLQKTETPMWIGLQFLLLWGRGQVQAFQEYKYNFP
jgi:hypothetical protein